MIGLAMYIYISASIELNIVREYSTSAIPSLLRIHPDRDPRSLCGSPRNIRIHRSASDSIALESPDPYDVTDVQPARHDHFPVRFNGSYGWRLARPYLLPLDLGRVSTHPRRTFVFSSDYLILVVESHTFHGN